MKLAGPKSLSGRRILIAHVAGVAALESPNHAARDEFFTPHGTPTYRGGQMHQHHQRSTLQHRSQDTFQLLWIQVLGQIWLAKIGLNGKQLQLEMQG